MEIVTMRFLDGILKGMEIKERNYAGFEEGKIYSCCVTGKKYLIVKVENTDEMYGSGVDEAN